MHHSRRLRRRRHARRRRRRRRISRESPERCLGTSASSGRSSRPERRRENQTPRPRSSNGDARARRRRRRARKTPRASSRRTRDSSRVVRTRPLSGGHFRWALHLFGDGSTAARTSARARASAVGHRIHPSPSTCRAFERARDVVASYTFVPPSEPHRVEVLTRFDDSSTRAPRPLGNAKGRVDTAFRTAASSRPRASERGSACPRRSGYE